MSEQLRLALGRYFAEFPPMVAEAIFQELLKENGLPGLLARLGAKDPGEPSQQYAELIRKLRRDGIGPLEKLVGCSLSGLEADTLEIVDKEDTAARRLDLERTKIQSPGPEVKKYQVPALVPQSSKPVAPQSARLTLVNTPKSESNEASKSAETPPKAPVPNKPTVPEAASATQPLRPAKPPEPGTFDARTPSWDPSKPHDPAGEWPAVERRSGRERRKGPRRQKVDVVYANKRFGKDRRAGVERRRNWPRGGHQP